MFRYTWIFLLLLPYWLLAQERPGGPAVRLLLLDESVSTPVLNPAKYPYAPAFQVGVEKLLRQRPRHELFLSSNLGFYFHRKLRTAVYGNVQFGYRYLLGRWQGALAVGPGLSLAYATQPVYVFADGTYREGRNNGDLLLAPAFAGEFGYRLGKNRDSAELLLHYGVVIESPFAVLPLPHLFTGVGLRFHPF